MNCMYGIATLYFIVSMIHRTVLHLFPRSIFYRKIRNVNYSNDPYL